MFSTQRFIILVIVLNMLIGLVSQINTDKLNFDGNVITTEIDYMNSSYVEFQSDEVRGEGDTIKESDQFQQTYGNQVRGGKVLWNTFAVAAVPWSVRASNYDNPLEVWLARLLTMFRSLLLIITVFEIYLLLFNKKAT